MFSVVFCILMAHQLINAFRLVVHTKAVNDGGTGLVHANHFHLCAIAAELDNHFVERTHGGNVPEMRTANIYHHFIDHFTEIKRCNKLFRRTEKHLARYLVGTRARGFIKSGLNFHKVANLVGKKQCGEQHTGKHTQRQVMGYNHNTHGYQHHYVGRYRVGFQVANGLPGESADRYHNHYGHQSSHRYLNQYVIQHHNHYHQEYACGKRGKPTATTGFDVDYGLPNHRAAGHTTKQTRPDVGNALPPALAVTIAFGIRQIVNNSGGHHGFQQTHNGQWNRIGQDNHQSFEVQWHVWPEKDWQGVGQFAHIAHRAYINIEQDCDDGQRHDAYQWRGQKPA